MKSRRLSEVVDLSNHKPMQTEIDPKQKASAANHEVKLDHERERAERLMAALLRAKADALEARATVARLEGEIAALRSRPWSHWLTRWKRQPNADAPFARCDLLTYTARLALVFSVAVTAAVLIGALNVSHNKTRASVATAAQELQAPVNADEDRSTPAANVWRNETTASVAATAQEMPAPVGDEALNISHNETTSAPAIEVPQAESEQQRVDPPSVMVSTPAPADTAAAVTPVSKKTAPNRTRVTLLYFERHAACSTACAVLALTRMWASASPHAAAQPRREVAPKRRVIILPGGNACASWCSDQLT